MSALTEARRNEIVWLLEHRNDHLPGARSASIVGRGATSATSGFVGGVDEKGKAIRWLTCPDCLANGMPNGRGMVGCETCGGRGEIPDPAADPYAENKVMPIGFHSTRHDATHERDQKIDMLARQTRPAPTEAELLEDANRRGYAWEEERRAMYRQYDFAELDQALDELRAHDVDAAHALNAVYVEGWMVDAGENAKAGGYVGYVTPLIEEHCQRGLVFLSERLPDPPRTGLHPAADRQRRRRCAA